MIDALITGKLHVAPVERTSKTGKPFATVRLLAAAGDGERVFVNLIAFEPAAVQALLALGAGDALAVAGTVTPRTYTGKTGEPRASLDVVAQQVLTAYHVTRKRQAVQQRPGPLESWEAGH